MNISSREVGDAIVVMVEGNLDTNTSPDAQNYLDQLVDSGSRKILISFESTNYVSSAGLRVVLATAKLLNKNGGDLRLCNLSSTVHDVFEISGFTTILNVFDSEKEAIASFQVSIASGLLPAPTRGLTIVRSAIMFVLRFQIKWWYRE